MKTVLIELFASKKFLTALSAVIIYLAGRWGFDVDAEVLDRIFAALLVYVGAQGVADAGKSAAQVRAGQSDALPPTPRNSEAGRARLTLLALLGLLAVVAVMITQGGCASSQRESTIKAALVTTDATREAYLAYDASKQQQIVEAATSLDDGRVKLAEHRAKRETVVTAITGVYRAIALAATLQDSQSLDALKRALEHAVSIVSLATGSKP